MSTVETILEKVRTLRRSKGYSQTEMADVFGQQIEAKFNPKTGSCFAFLLV
jgi:transcriptional regulator with XRE-family HTH domain